MPSVDVRFKEWQSRLLDLTKRNRLLYFRPVKRGNLLMTEPSPDDIFEWLVKEDKRLTFPQRPLDPFPVAPHENPDPATAPPERVPPLHPGEVRTNQTDEQLALTLYAIRSKARTALEEQGVNVLYLTFGMLKWFGLEDSTEAIHSPLVLVPVELARGSIARPYTLELIDEDILLNPTLLYKLQGDFHLSFPSLPEDWTATTLQDILRLCEETIQGQRGWSIAPEVHLGLFSFEKLVMLKDLEAHARQAQEHALVAALAGDRSRLAPVPADLPTPETLDAGVRPEETFQILDADSSQQEAIALAKRDVSFVMQGPPGTGKSQTIANIIAESLAQGKKVLFVSEKMAALKVVYKRLSETGLAEFCLEAHSHKANKSAIVAQLGQTLNSALSTHPDGFQTRLAQLVELRERLNGYAQALHAAHPPLGWTAFQVHGRLAALERAPDLIFGIENVRQVDAARLAAMDAALNRLLAESKVWDRQEEHPWRGTLVQTFSFETQSDIQQHLSTMISVLPELERAAQELAEVLKVPAPASLREVRALSHLAALVAETPSPHLDWVQDRQIPDRVRVVGEAQPVFDEYRSCRAELLALHTEALLALPDLADMVHRFETSYRSVLRVLSSDYRRDMQRIQATAVGGRKVGYPQALLALQLAQRARAAREWIDAHANEHTRLFGRWYAGADTRWDALLAALRWSERLIQHFSPAPVPDAVVDIVCHQPNTVERAKDAAAQLDPLLERAGKEESWLGTIFAIERTRVAGARLDQADLGQLRAWLELRLDHLNALKKWLDFAAARHECERQGVGGFMLAAETAGVRSERLGSAFYKRLYRLWLDAVYAEEPALQHFSGEQHSRLIDQFRGLDREQLSIAQRRIRAQLAALRPRTSFVEAPSSEVVILKRELEKKKRHKAIRKLFAEIPNLLLTIKPCLMMSPLSVSQFLSAGHFEFDAVIFDEASQISPEDAISAIMRGKQIIVAGDRHQLPPTPFFRSLGIDFEDWEGDEGASLESLLQECSVNLPDRLLKWHYRSRHESLIAFSNQYVYANQLITFPNSREVGADLGLEFIHVPEGIYDRSKSRQNPVEAKRIAELVMEHYARTPERSLGVVAFSEAQREAIDQELLAITHQDPEFELCLNQGGSEPFFVKNLENVQGDERDVVFFSVGYGRDAAGRLTMNFGPLNGEDGARRLNVAITRARDHVKLVSSILPEDIDPDYPNRGIQLLRSYMAYARAGGQREAPAETAAPETQAEFEQAVYEALVAHGLAVDRRVGRSGYRIDLAVRDPARPGHYLLGIECDGAMYHSAKTARDRERLRQQVLEGLGWRIQRVWSREWIADPAAQVQKIVEAVERAKQAAEPALVPPASPSAPADAARAAPEPQKDAPAPTPDAGEAGNGLPKGVEYYSYAALARQGTPEQFYRATAQTLGRVLAKVVEQEGPVHFGAACRRVAGCWGVTRVGRSVQARVHEVAQILANRQYLQYRDEFLWPLRAGPVVVRRPAPGQAPRPIEEIALEEIAQAAYLCLEDAYSLSREDLVTQTARLLGYDRAGDKLRERILLALDQLLRDQRIAVNGDKVALG